MSRQKITQLLTITFLFLSFVLTSAHAVDAVITAVNGNVGIRIQNVDPIQPAAVGKTLAAGDVIVAGEKSFAEVTLLSGQTVHVDEKTVLIIQLLDETNTIINLPKGKVRAHVSSLLKNQTFEIKTPAATCAIRGTDFEVSVLDTGKTEVRVYQGLVEAQEIVTGRSVFVSAGMYTSLLPGEPPADPQKITEAGTETKATKEERIIQGKKEIFEEISQQDVLNQAIDDIKKAEYQNGKTLVDAYGKRVRLEEYIMRPQTDQFKYVVLNKRESRFDFGKILFTFNKDLPEDLTVATEGMFHNDNEAPDWYPTDILSVMSNTTDSVTEEASGGHPETVESGNDIYYDTVFNTYYFKANDTTLWGYDKTIVPEEEYYYDPIDNNNTEPTSLWVQPDGSQKFHFIAKDTYADNTWIQAEDFIINDNGDIASFSDIVDPSNISAEDIRSKILQLNFERVYTSSLFDDRKIDLVFSSKLLSDAGLITLPSSLSAPRLCLYSDTLSSQGYVKLAKLRDTGEQMPEAEKPYEDENTQVPLVNDQHPGMIKHMLSAEVLGGQYFVEGDNTSFKGNMDVLYVPAVNFSENTALLPIYNATYQGTKSVVDLVGGGTLFQQSMAQALFIKMVHKTLGNWTYKGVLGGSAEWLKETDDETLSDGLFNNVRYTAGVTGERSLGSKKIYVTYNYSFTDYYHYQALSSDDVFSEAGITNSMGTDVLNFTNQALIAGFKFPMSDRSEITSEYQLSYLMFPDQKIIQRSGEYASNKRGDFAHTVILNSILNTPFSRLGMGYGFKYYRSNQNAYDANRTFYTDNYYGYMEHKITPSISFMMGKNPAVLSLYWDLTLTKYADRKTQDIEGNYGTNTIGQVTNAWGLWMKYPLFKQFSLKMKMNYLMSSSNMKYEKTYSYNYDVVNYFIGVGWEL